MLEKLKKKFTEFKKLRLNITTLFERLQQKKNKLNEIYKEYIEKSSLHQESMFGLDSFHFQNKMIDTEYQNMEKLYVLIDNKIYGEYYKLANVMIKYIRHNIHPVKKNPKSQSQSNSLQPLRVHELTELIKKYPVYKDLQEQKQFDHNIVYDIHSYIIQLLEECNTHLTTREAQLQQDQQQSALGINIDNYVFTYSHQNVILREQIKLYINYLLVFHKYHSRYLRKFQAKLTMMWEQLNEDITIEQPQHEEDNQETSETDSDDDDDDESSHESDNENQQQTVQSSTPTPPAPPTPLAPPAPPAPQASTPTPAPPAPPAPTAPLPPPQTTEVAPPTLSTSLTKHLSVVQEQISLLETKTSDLSSNYSSDYSSVVDTPQSFLTQEEIKKQKKRDKKKRQKLNKKKRKN